MVQCHHNCATLPDLVDGILIFHAPAVQAVEICLIETSKIIKTLRNAPLRVKERVAAKERARRERLGAPDIDSFSAWEGLEPPRFIHTIQTI